MRHALTAHRLACTDLTGLSVALPSRRSPGFGQCLLRYSMTTAASAHLVVLANENGGGFDVQPGQQQAGGTVQHRHGTVMLQTHITAADTTYTHMHTGHCFLTVPCQVLAQDILSDLVEDACLGLCFEVHRAVKQGYFFLDDTDQESMRDFGEHSVGTISQAPIITG